MTLLDGETMRHMSKWIPGLTSFAVAAALSCAAQASEPVEVTLDGVSPLGSMDQVIRRVLTPIAREELRQVLAKTGKGVQQQTIRAGDEHYDLFVPPVPPNGRYGVLVFVYPSARFPVPREWWDTLERDGLIFIAARKSGNATNVLDRRIPLALHGYDMVEHRYPIDPSRVYVGGFSGGSRVAQMIAMGYSDIFRGALMFAGSDVIGDGTVVPPRELMQLFQQRTRLVLLTGSEDTHNRSKDARARNSLESFCVQGVVVMVQNRLDHWVPSKGGFRRALHALQQPVNAGKDFDACRQRLQAGIDAGLDEVSTSIGSGDMTLARKRLREIDQLYGGLAAPRSVELARIIAGRLRRPDIGGD